MVLTAERHELLSKWGTKAGSAHKHRWTDEEREIVRRDYTGTHQSKRDIAARLGVTQNAVAGQIMNMGLGNRSDRDRRKPWSEKEDEQLRELLGKYAPRTVAEKMVRSLNSVMIRGQRLGISRRCRDGWYTKKECCEILGMDHKWVQRRIDEGTLKATWHFGTRPSQKGSASWHIEEEDLIAFIKKYPQDLNGRNVDLIQIVGLLSGGA
jgi:DNA-binding CsgD family transcriptional regulator